MSTKIYHAYRMPTKILPDFLSKFRAHIFKQAVKTVNEMTAHQDVAPELQRTYDKLDEDGRVSFEEFVEKNQRVFLYRAVFRKLIEASASPFRDPLHCLDSSLCIWWYKGKFYVIPYGEYRMFGNIKLPVGVEDYAYWNNADQPEGISLRAWRRRGETWDEVCLDDWHSTRTVHEIINAKEHLGLEQLATLCLGKKDESRVWNILGALRRPKLVLEEENANS